MTYRCINDVDLNYKKLIDYAIAISDTVSFHVVHYDIMSPEIKKMEEEYKKRYPNAPNISFNDESEYYSRINEIIEPITDAIIDKISDFSYLGYKYGHLCETFFVDAKNQKVKEFLFKADSIFSWHYPDFPEDICFFRRGKIWLRSIAHEKLLLFENISEAETEHLKKFGINLYLEEDGTGDG